MTYTMMALHDGCHEHQTVAACVFIPSRRIQSYMVGTSQFSHSLLRCASFRIANHWNSLPGRANCMLWLWKNTPCIQTASIFSFHPVMNVDEIIKYMYTFAFAQSINLASHFANVTGTKVYESETFASTWHKQTYERIVKLDVNEIIKTAWTNARWSITTTAWTAFTWVVF